VVVHGAGDQVRVGNRLLRAAEFDDLLDGLPHTRGLNLALISCFTGGGAVGTGFVRRLGMLRHRPMIGASGLAAPVAGTMRSGPDSGQAPWLGYLPGEPEPQRLVADLFASIERFTPPAAGGSSGSTAPVVDASAPLFAMTPPPPDPRFLTLVPVTPDGMRDLSAGLRGVRDEWDGRLAGSGGEAFEAWVAFGRALDAFHTQVFRLRADGARTGPDVIAAATVGAGALAAYEAFRGALTGDRPPAPDQVLAPAKKPMRAMLDLGPASLGPPVGTTVDSDPIDDAVDYTVHLSDEQRRDQLTELLATLPTDRVQSRIAAIATLALGRGGPVHQRELATAGVIATTLGQGPAATAPSAWATEKLRRAATTMTPREASDWIAGLDTVASARPAHAAALLPLRDILRPVADRAATPGAPSSEPADVWAPVRQAHRLAPSPRTPGTPPPVSMERLETWILETERDTAGAGLPAKAMARVIGGIAALEGALADPSMTQGPERTDVEPVALSAAAGAPFQELDDARRAWSLVLSTPNAAVWFQVPGRRGEQPRWFGLVGDGRGGRVRPRWVDPAQPGLFGAPASLSDERGASLFRAGVKALARDGAARPVDVNRFQIPRPKLSTPAPSKQARPTRSAEPDVPKLAELIATGDWASALALFKSHRDVLESDAALAQLEHRIRTAPNIRDRLTTFKGIIALSRAGRLDLAEEYLAAPDARVRRLIIAAAVPAAEPGTPPQAHADRLSALADLSRGVMQSNSERADVAVVTSTARVLRNLPADVDRELVPRFIRPGIRVEWFRHLQALADLYGGRYAEAINEIILEVLRC
jgi:hypothetical protein